MATAPNGPYYAGHDGHIYYWTGKGYKRDGLASTYLVGHVEHYTVPAGWKPPGDFVDPAGFKPQPPPGNSPGGGGGSSGGGSGGGGGGFALTTKAGTKLTQASYDALVANYRHYGLVYGYNLSDSQVHTLALNDVTPAEFQTRLDDVARANSFAPYLQELTLWARATGQIKPNASIDPLKYTLGLAPAEFYAAHNAATAATNAVEAGFSVGGTALGQTQATNPDLRLGMGHITGLLNALGVTAGTPLTAGQLNSVLQAAAKSAVETLPNSRYKSYGVSKQDILNVAGGVGTEQANAAVARIANEEQAFEQVRAHPAFSAFQQAADQGRRTLAGAPTV